MSMKASLKLVSGHGASTPHGRIHLPLGRSYSTEELKRDLLAGFTVGAISLLQAMAQALLAGVDPRF